MQEKNTIKKFYRYKDVGGYFPIRDVVYEILEPEDKRIEKIREKGIRVSHIPSTGNKKYIKEINEVSLEERYKKIEALLDSENQDNKKIYDDVIETWEEKSCHKNQSDSLDDCVSTFLSSLADYCLSGYEGDNILDDKKWEKIKKYEVAGIDFLSDDNDSEGFSDGTSHSYEKNKITDKRKKEYKKFKKAQLKRWKHSLTRRMDKIYSYDNTKPEREFILGKYVDIKPRVAVKYDRKIDKSKPYLSSWETVDTDGFFLFNDKIFIVKDKQYKCNPLADKGFVQDKILCYMQDDKYYFYDMEVKELKDVKEI